MKKKLTKIEPQCHSCINGQLRNQGETSFVISLQQFPPMFFKIAMVTSQQTILRDENATIWSQVV